MSKQPLILMDTDPPSVRVAPSSHMLMCSPAELLPLLTGMALDPYIDNARDNAREKGDARNIPMKDGSIVHEGFVAKFLDDGSAAMIEVEDKPKVKRRSAWTTNSRGESPSKFNNLHGLPGLKVKTATVKVIDDESISISSEDDGWRVSAKKKTLAGGLVANMVGIRFRNTIPPSDPEYGLWSSHNFTKADILNTTASDDDKLFDNLSFAPHAQAWVADPEGKNAGQF
ncbi:hypothetical protein BKA70DRAFT_1225420 [Coprinopsis sp. MPI-PUGE-AT-0042]|nr:hypothetical protein BKA70DRAFT_1225420 [Coprinopsis sp. MPI-PUGE-AT-0042]